MANIDALKKRGKETLGRFTDFAEEHVGKKEMRLLGIPKRLPPAFEDEIDGEARQEKAENDRYIIDENALLIFPTLACVFGLTESIILQQVHYFVSIKRENRAEQYYQRGRYWTYASYKAWNRQLPYVSLPTIKRALGHLVAAKVLFRRTQREKGMTLTWYAINYSKLAEEINSYKGCKEKPYQENLLHKVYYDEGYCCILARPKKSSLKPPRFRIKR